VVFAAPADAALAIDDPALWWPVGHGEQPQYDVQLAASIATTLSDQIGTTFGIRQVTSTIMPGGGRQFVINGRPVQILGGGWCPTYFYAMTKQRLVDEMTYTVADGTQYHSPRRQASENRSSTTGQPLRPAGDAWLGVLR